MATDFDPTPLIVDMDGEVAPDDEEDLTKAEIIASLRQALKELKAGKGRPALEVLDEIDREMREDAD